MAKKSDIDPIVLHALKDIAERMGGVSQGLSDVSLVLTELQKTAKAHESTLTRQEASLGEHMRRTENLEKRIKPLETSTVRWSIAAKFVVPILSLAFGGHGLLHYLLKLY